MYVSCNPSKSLVRDAVVLCGPRSQRLHEEAFRPVRAVPCDIFPNCLHCEMVLVFSRESEVGTAPAVAGGAGERMEEGLDEVDGAPAAAVAAVPEKEEG